MRVRRAVAVLLAVCGASASATAQSPNLRELFRWEVAPGEAHAVGDTAWVVSALIIAPEHYVYAERTAVSVEPHEGLAIGAPVASAPHVAWDEFEGREVAKYVEQAVFRIPVVPGPSLSGQSLPLKLTLRTQGCSKKTCYFPMTEERTVLLTVLPSGGELKDFSSASGQPDQGRFDLGNMLAESGLFIALGAMFLGGILTSFTPCVYPLIPITVSFFGASRAKNSTLRSFLLSLVFVLGMAAMYSVLGVSAAATGAVFGSVMANPFVIGFVALLFVLFAASMFGAFEMQLPSSWQMRLKRVGGAGFGGSFAAGLVAGVIAAPCTGPVLGAALAYVATTGDLRLGFSAMFSFALGMGLLFIVIGTFSARVVPKSGPWLEKIKSIFGIVMLTAALYFLKDVIPPLKDLMRPGTTALVVSLVLVVFGLALGAVHLRFVAGLDREGDLEAPPSLLERTRKTLGVAMVVAGLYGIIGVVLAPPKPSGAVDLASLPHPEWITDEAAGLVRARREGKPVLIDVYADWCAACKELDRYTYSDPAVRARLNEFVCIKLDMTNMTPEREELRRKYAVLGLPTVIFLDGRGEELKDRRTLGFLPPEEFLKRLEGVR